MKLMKLTDKITGKPIIINAELIWAISPTFSGTRIWQNIDSAIEVAESMDDLIIHLTMLANGRSYVNGVVVGGTVDVNA